MDSETLAANDSCLRDFVPDRFRFSHQYAFYLHDRLARLLVDGEREGVFETHFTIEEGRSRPDEATHIFDWLEVNQRGDVLGEVLLKTVFPALLSDFCHFLYEALSCSQKGKLTVAFALLRKPLRETLHYLEWMLASPDEFLSTLYSEDAIALSFSRIGDPSRLKNVIALAVERCIHSDALDPDLIYRVRFDREFEGGLDSMCNQAMHLITTKSPIATLKQNFNFIFSNDEDKDAQWETLYSYLPLLLFYATDVVESLIAVIRKDALPDFQYAALQRSIGFVVWTSELPSWRPGDEVDPSSDLEFECPSCNATLRPTLQDLYSLFWEVELPCPECASPIGIKQLAAQPS